MSQLPIKVSYLEDIRRFSVTPHTPFELICASIARFYNLAPGTFQILTEDKKTFNQEILNSLFNELKKEFFVLRLTVEEVPLSKVSQEKDPAPVQKELSPPVESPPESKNPESVDMVDLFSDPTFKTLLSDLLRKALAAKPLMELLQNDFAQNLVNLMSEIAEEQKKASELLSVIESQKVGSGLEPLPTISSESPKVTSEPLVDTLVSTTEELVGESLSEKKEDPGFPLLDGPFSPIRNFFSSLFKKKEEEKVIPNMEELLSQLAELGFADRELNVNIIKFHSQFNEGLSEIVDDLMQREKEKVNS